MGYIFPRKYKADRRGRTASVVGTTSVEPVPEPTTFIIISILSQR